MSPGIAAAKACHRVKPMAFDRKDMTGALFPNDKEGNDKRPDWRGSVLIEGKTWYVSAWEQVAQSDGKRYLSLKVGAPQAKTPSYDWKAAEASASRQAEINQAAIDQGGFDDTEIPF